MPADLQGMYYEDGSAFYTDERLHPGGSPFEDADGRQWEDFEIVQFAAAIWNLMYEAKRAEIERLKTNSLFVDGFHYADPRENRQNAITNRIYQAVEAQVAAAIAVAVAAQAAINTTLTNAAAAAQTTANQGVADAG